MKQFTAFIIDVDRLPEDPRIIHFETSSAADMHGDIETAYFYECNCGNDVDPDEIEGMDISFDGANGVGELWRYKGAAVIGVIPGHLEMAWNPDGMSNADYNAAWALKL